ncbi:MAG: hypothetical protein H6649_06185 [Caldilineae bacterium]|nr:hypothetical protein [Caldilineae bacterium]
MVRTVPAKLVSGLRNMGLLNIFLVLLGVPAFLALYGAIIGGSTRPMHAGCDPIAHRGGGFWLPTAPLPSPYELDRQYAAIHHRRSTSGADRGGQTMLSVGRRHTPGFSGIFPVGSGRHRHVGGDAQGQDLQQSRRVRPTRGLFDPVGLRRYFSFAPGLDSMAKLLSMVGGLLTLVWPRFWWQASLPTGAGKTGHPDEN